MQVRGESNRHGPSRRPWLRLFAAIGMLPVVGGAQCYSVPVTPSGIYGNSTDFTNGNSTYIGSAACIGCHSNYGAMHSLHGHAHALNRVQGQAPAYPAVVAPVGVPDPPAGFGWNDISYVIGGYQKTALFVNLDGYVLTNGVDLTDTRWNLDHAPNGTVAGFVPYEPGLASPKPFEFSEFRHRTTGAMAQDPAFPEFQDNRPGIGGTWIENGVQCEACHGPGARHVSRTFLRNQFVDPTGAMTCYACHSRPFGSTSAVISAQDGYLLPQTEYPSLLSSGGHKDFRCTYCHNPHASVNYDRENAIRNECTACHTDQNMALHEDNVLMRGEYTEEVTCQSCHMAYATRSGSSATAAVVGGLGRMGDSRSHIFRINTERVGFEAMFTADGSEVVKDAEGRAAVTVDFVCLRCHNGIGAFTLSINSAADIALNIHETP